MVLPIAVLVILEASVVVARPCSRLRTSKRCASDETLASFTAAPARTRETLALSNALPADRDLRKCPTVDRGNAPARAARQWASRCGAFFTAAAGSPI